MLWLSLLCSMPPAANANVQPRSGWGTIIPKNCEYAELTKLAPNGQLVYDATGTNINHQMSGDMRTQEFAAEAGIMPAVVQTRDDGTYINSSDADWTQVETNKELAAKKYLRVRYNGDYVTGRLAEIDLDTLHSWEIYAFILKVYGSEETDTTETAKRACSQCAVKMLRDQHGELYDIIEHRQLTFPSKHDGNTYVVDDFTSIPAWVAYITAEIFKHNKLFERIKSEILPNDLEQVATEDRLLHRLRNMQSTLKLSCMASLGATAMLNKAKKLRGKAPPAEGNMEEGYDLGYLQALVHLDAMYESQRPNPPRDYCGLVAAVTEPEAAAPVTPPKLKTRLIKGDCINHWTGGPDGRGCKFDPDECHFKHGPPGSKGSIPYKPREAARPNNKERRFAGKCYKCNKTGHRANDCPQTDTVAATEQAEETVSVAYAARQVEAAVKLAKAKWKREWEDSVLSESDDDGGTNATARPSQKARVNGMTMVNFGKRTMFLMALAAAMTVPTVCVPTDMYPPPMTLHHMQGSNYGSETRHYSLDATTYTATTATMVTVAFILVIGAIIKPMWQMTRAGGIKARCIAGKRHKQARRGGIPIKRDPKSDAFIVENNGRARRTKLRASTRRTIVREMLTESDPPWMICGINKRKNAMSQGGRHTRESTIIMDSGANIHASNCLEAFTHMRWLAKPQAVKTAAGTRHPVKGIGRISIEVLDQSGNHRTIQLENVKYCPEMGATYISVGILRKKLGWTVSGNKICMEYTDPDGHTYRCSQHNGQDAIFGRWSSLSGRHTPTVAGFVSADFQSKIDQMSEKQLVDCFEHDSLNRWEIQTVRLRLAKRGILTFEDDRSRLLELHHRLCHISLRRTALFARKHGIPMTDVERVWCAACLMKNQKKKGRPRISKRFKNPQDGKQRVVSYRSDQSKMAEQAREEARKRIAPNTQYSADIWGPVEKSTNGSHQYTLTFAEARGGRTWSYYLKDLREIPNAVDEWLNQIKQQLKQGGVEEIDCNLSPNISLRTDSASQFKGAGMKRVMQKHSVQLTFSPPGEQYQNHRAEHALGQLAMMVKATLKASGLSMQDWDWCWAHCEKVRNSVPRTMDKDKSPYEISTGKAPKDPSTYLGFGQRVSVRVTAPDGKMSDKARLGTYLGHDAQTNCPIVRVTSKSGRRVIRVSGEIRADPMMPPGIYQANAMAVPDEDCWEWITPEEHVLTGEGQKGREPEPEEREDTPPSEFEQFMAYDTHGNEIPDDHCYGDTIEIETGHVSAVTASLQSSSESKPIYSLGRAQKRWPQRHADIETAVQTERDGLIRVAMEPIDRDSLTPEETAGVSTLLAIYSEKLQGHMYQRMKLRCCYKGQTEVEGIDYITTANHQPRLSTLRVWLGLAPVSMCAQSFQGDISMAFIRANLEAIPANEKRLVAFPGDISKRDASGQRQIYRLTRSLYGLHSSAASWETMLWLWLESIGLEQCEIDPALWFRRNARGTITMYVIVWTDDLGWRGTKADCAWFRAAAEKQWGDIRTEPLSHLLGLKIHTNERGHHGISSQSYVEKLVETEGLTDSKSCATPLPPSTRITKDDRLPEGEYDKKLQKQFQKTLGCLNYLATWSCPQIAYYCSALSSVASGPAPHHLKWARRVVKYLKGSKDLGLQWDDPGQLNTKGISVVAKDRLEIWTDASFAGEEGYASQSGFVAVLNGAPVHWSSTKQSFPALSSTEAEIIAAGNALRYTLHLKMLLEAMGRPQGAIRFNIDAENCIRFMKRDKITPRNHHIGTRYMRMRHHVGKDIDIAFCSTTEMVADIHTKCAEEKQFNELTARIMTSFAEGQ